MGLEILSPGPPEGWTEAEFASDLWENFLDFGLGVQNPRYYKDSGGVVWVQVAAAFVLPDGDDWWEYAGFSHPVIVLPVGYRPDQWVGPIGGVSTNMSGITKTEPTFVLADGKVLFPSLSGGEVVNFAATFSFRAAN